MVNRPRFYIILVVILSFFLLLGHADNSEAAEVLIKKKVIGTSTQTVPLKIAPAQTAPVKKTSPTQQTVPLKMAPAKTAPVKRIAPVIKMRQLKTLAVVVVKSRKPVGVSVAQGGTVEFTLEGTNLSPISSVKVYLGAMAVTSVTATLDKGSSTARKVTLKAGDSASIVPGYNLKFVAGTAMVSAPANVTGFSVIRPFMSKTRISGQKSMSTQAENLGMRQKSMSTQVEDLGMQQKSMSIQAENLGIRQKSMSTQAEDLGMQQKSMSTQTKNLAMRQGAKPRTFRAATKEVVSGDKKTFSMDKNARILKTAPKSLVLVGEAGTPFTPMSVSGIRLEMTGMHGEPQDDESPEMTGIHFVEPQIIDGVSLEMTGMHGE